MLEQILIAGILYLIVIAIVLTIKPKFMFTEEGVWKEFGIGRNPATHTWMPFWLFSILWALVSYIFVTIILSLYYGSSSRTETQNTTVNKSRNRSVSLNLEDETSSPVVLKNKGSSSSSAKRQGKSKGTAMNLPDGYYILNSEATEEAGGVPKYIFLGKGMPSDD